MIYDFKFVIFDLSEHLFHFLPMLPEGTAAGVFAACQ